MAYYNIVYNNIKPFIKTFIKTSYDVPLCIINCQIVKHFAIMKKEHIKALLLFAKLTYGTCDINFDDCINCLYVKAKELGMDYKDYLTKVVTQSQLV